MLHGGKRQTQVRERERFKKLVVFFVKEKVPERQPEKQSFLPSKKKVKKIKKTGKNLFFNL